MKGCERFWRNATRSLSDLPNKGSRETHMTTPANNPRVTAFRDHIRLSYEKLLNQVDGPLASLKPEQLYQQPFNDEWTVMENLAHIAEFMLYWMNEFSKVIAEPGSRFGRTVEDAGRLAAIRDHGHEALSKMRAKLEKSYTYLDSRLSNLKDGDLETVGHHVKYGERPIGGFIDEFVVRHLATHVVQIHEALNVLVPASGTI